MTEQDVTAIFHREFNKNYFAGNTRVPPHTHNGIDNLKLSASSLVGLSVGGFTTMQAFTTSGTLPVPDGVDFMYVQLVGGGGSSGASSGGGGNASGGSAAGYAAGLVDVSGQTSISVTVGAGGTAPTSGTVNGNPGGNSSFGSFMTSTGGLGGQFSGAPVAGQNATGGDVNIVGGDSGPGYGFSVSTTTSAGMGGFGGASFFGPGGTGIISQPSTSAVGNPGLVPGSGGGGSSAGSGTPISRAGSVGANGIVIVMY